MHIATTRAALSSSVHVCCLRWNHCYDPMHVPGRNRYGHDDMAARDRASRPAAGPTTQTRQFLAPPSTDRQYARRQYAQQQKQWYPGALDHRGLRLIERFHGACGCISREDNVPRQCCTTTPPKYTTFTQGNNDAVAESVQLAQTTSRHSRATRVSRTFRG